MGREISDLVREMRELHHHISQLQAELVHCIAEFDTAQGYQLQEYSSTAAWLRTELHLHPREAAQLVGLARALRQLPAVDQAFTAGEISQPHAAVLARATRQVGAERVGTVESELLALARSAGPQRLRLATEHLRYCLDPDAADRDAVRAYAKRELSLATTIGGLVSIQGLLDPVSGATVLAAVTALTPPPREDDPRTAGQRRADALTELCRRALDHGDLPHTGGEKPHLLITVAYETLRGQPGAAPAALSWVGPITATQARLAACDCGIVPAVLGSTGEVLDIGRKTRLWPAGIARAIALRDRTCHHRDCDAPPEHCDIHHRRHWVDGGPTSYDNGILACRHHHTQLHTYGATYHPNGQFTITRNRQ